MYQAVYTILEQVSCLQLLCCCSDHIELRAGGNIRHWDLHWVLKWAVLPLPN